MKFFYRFHANAECQLGLSGWSLTSSPAHLFARRGWLGLSVELRLYRSSRSEVLCKKGALENFAKSTGKHLCQSLFFNKVAGPGLGLQLYYKREPDPGVFQNF